MLVAFDAVEGSTDAQCSAPAEERESEVSLSKEIVALWSTHQDGKASAKRTREDLKAIRSDLGERLHAMKALLARTGRGGQWASYLRQHRIPRTTADRCVRDHEENLNPGSKKGTSGAISEPTEADVTKFFERLLPRLRSALATQQAVFDFVCHLLFDLPGVHGDVTDSAVEIYRPEQKSVAQ
jgi:hypothetical protein